MKLLEKTTTKTQTSHGIVTSVNHWNENLFSFRITRPNSLRFRAGEFIMLGLEINGKPLYRAYSICSPLWDNELEFYSIKVRGGALTGHLQNIKLGDKILLTKKATGTLVLENLLAGRNCYLFSSGTGLAPFASLLRDSEIYEKFQKIILTHSARKISDLSYGVELIARIKKDVLVGKQAKKQLLYFPTTTKQPSENFGRITNYIENKKLFQKLGVSEFAGQDRAMICGSLSFNNSLKQICQNVGLQEGSNSNPSTFVLEKAFVG